MQIGPISPRNVAMALGAAAAAGLVTGGVLLTTNGAQAGSDTPAAPTASAEHTKSHKHQTQSPADAGATTGVTAPASKAGNARDKKPKKHPSKTPTPPSPTASPSTVGSSTPSPSVSPTPTSSISPAG